MTEGSPQGRRGRPPGSVSLTQDIQDIVVSYTRAGALPHVAARSAGIAPRTFFDWMARGEGKHPDRPCTPKLKAFAREVRKAEADARSAQEIRVYREDPKYWLKHAARSRPDYDGWTQPVEARAESGSERLAQMIARLDDEEAHERGCTDPGCIGRKHKEQRYP